jgi:endonuclease VIII-like 1
MPEGPEIHQAAFFINQCADKYQFGGPIVKSAVSIKNPDIGWTAKSYSLRAEARGKELKVHLTDATDASRGTSVLFRFGMSGCFQEQSYLNFVVRFCVYLVSVVDSE